MAFYRRNFAQVTSRRRRYWRSRVWIFLLKQPNNITISNKKALKYSKFHKDITNMLLIITLPFNKLKVSTFLLNYMYCYNVQTRHFAEYISVEYNELLTNRHWIKCRYETFKDIIFSVNRCYKKKWTEDVLIIQDYFKIFTSLNRPVLN